MSAKEYIEARDEMDAAEVALQEAEAIVAKGVNMASAAIIARAADRKVKARDRLRAICLGDTH